MKKVIKMTMCLILICTTLIFSACGIIVSNYNYCNAIFDEQNFTITTDREEGLKILALADIHISAAITGAYYCGMLKIFISNVKPDLIVLMGDNLVWSTGDFSLKFLINYFDSLQIPWAIVMGNHDYESRVAMETYASELDNSKYCLFKKGTTDGYGNYVYNYEKDGEQIYSLFFMDSKTGASYITSGNTVETGQKNFSSNQVSWYESQVNRLKAENGNVLVKSLMFFHIPLCEYSLASAQYAQGLIEGTGENREVVCEQDENTGMFAKIKELASTTDVFVGHDHINNANMNYEGVNLCYCVKSSIASYYNSDMLGGKVIEISNDGLVSSTNVFTKL